MPPPTPSNPYRLLYAGFFSILAAGVGFSVRAAILPDWAREFGFTNYELGQITGGGLVGFGIVIILGSLIADRVGYGSLMSLAFLMHVLSAALVLFTRPIREAWGTDAVYWSLYVSMFLFSIGNGLCEVVVNPMTATLFPHAKTHYLNVLHAGWPGGLVVGMLAGWLMNEPSLGDWAPGWKVDWMIQMSLFLIPVVIYGLMLLGQRLPSSEASEAGVSFGKMLLEFASPVLLLLLFVHALVGYVELGTDSWITTITGGILGEGVGRLLFVYTSALMFILRFFAGPLEMRLSPLGLLFLCAVLATGGLVLVSRVPAGAVWMGLAALTVYGIGKTYFWPTMLAVVSERYPRGGALTLGAIGGVGMLSAGLLGGPGLGFKQDYAASAQLKQEAPDTYARYKAEKPNSFYGLAEVQGLDGTKKSLLKLATKKAESTEEAKLHAAELQKTLELTKMTAWWQQAKEYAPVDKEPIQEADIHGGRMALFWTAAVPAVMAVLYLLLIGYFKARGGYKAEVLLEGGHLPPEEYTGGVEGPVR